MKENSDGVQRAKTSERSIGDTVLVKQSKYNKLSTNFNPELHIVVKKKGTMITACIQRTDHTITRNTSRFKNFPMQKGSEADSDRRGQSGYAETLRSSH